MGGGRSILAYAVTRIALAIPMLLILLTAIFVILRILPGDPVLALWGGNQPGPDVIADARARLGLDKPIHVQYWDYMTSVLRGDLGVSIGFQYRGSPVWTEIGERLPATLELTIASMVVAVFAGVTPGVIAGSRRDSKLDVAIRIYSTIIYAIPIFWLGLVFQIVFAVWLGWLPANGRWTGSDVPTARTGMFTVDALLEGSFDHFGKAVRHLVLPALTLGLVLGGFFTKTVRASMLQTVGADFSDAARARGIPEWRVVYYHAFRNALPPVVTVLGLQFAILFAGAVLTERTFSIDGIGNLLLTAITSKDMTVIQGVIVVYATIIVTISLVIDIVGAMIDPRVRL